SLPAGDPGGLVAGPGLRKRVGDRDDVGVRERRPVADREPAVLLLEVGDELLRRRGRDVDRPQGETGDAFRDRRLAEIWRKGWRRSVGDLRFVADLTHLRE